MRAGARGDLVKGADQEQIVRAIHTVAAGEVVDGANTDIARRLHLSDKTIRNQVSNIFAELRVDGRSQAIVRAARIRRLTRWRRVVMA